MEVNSPDLNEAGTPPRNGADQAAGDPAIQQPARGRERGPRERELPQVQQADEAGELVKHRFLEFLNSFTLDVEAGTEDFSQTHQAHHHYQTAVHQMAIGDESCNTLFVDYTHMVQFDFELAEAVEMEYYRFDPFLREALQTLVAANHPDHARDQDSGNLKEFYVGFYGVPSIQKVRHLRTDKVGRLSAFSGTVTRTTDVRPELIEGTFNCGKCGLAVPSVVQQYQYTVPPMCKNPHCTNTNEWHLDLENSVFSDWQRLRVQENADEIPPGSMPRSVNVILRGQTVEKAKAGDKVVFCGMLVVVPDTSQLSRAGEAASLNRSSVGRSMGGVSGLKRLGVRELTYQMSFIACSVQPTEQIEGQHNIRSDGDLDLASEFTPDERHEIMRMKEVPALYSKMVDSIAPTVFGHSEIKRGVLLMLFGGVHKKTKEGIKLRGDINVCIVGDPSTSKSQFLKYVHGFLPRAIYTSGKASSAAGLTASVSKDPETNEFCVEAGALMLADNGICCIDEFDKMDQGDQVAIHEAMEQQTISITKAGIQATLNARTSILAAANPLFGRYDRTKTLKANVQISAPIMSRFDLFFVVLDECDEVSDYNIADHIIAVHRQKEAALNPPFTTEQLQRYIRFARAFKPKIGKEGAKKLVECYRLLREGDSLGRNKAAYRITVRQLESLIRLSEALARLHLDDFVREKYVAEAFRLLRQSIIRVESEDVTLDDSDAELEAGDEEDQNLHGSSEEAENNEGNQQEEIQQMHETENGPETTDADNAVSSKESENGPETTDADNAVSSKESEPRPKPHKKKIQITFEQYQKVANSIAMYLRRKEERDNVTGVLRNEIIDWYLEEHEAELGSEEELNKMRRLVNQVITRLIKKDGVLMVHAKDNEAELVAVHPNYEIS